MRTEWCRNTILGASASAPVCKVGYATSTKYPKRNRRTKAQWSICSVLMVFLVVATVSVEIESYRTHRYFLPTFVAVPVFEYTTCQSSDENLSPFYLVRIFSLHIWLSFFICLIGRFECDVHKYCIKSTRIFIIWFFLLIYCHTFFLSVCVLSRPMFAHSIQQFHFLFLRLSSRFNSIPYLLVSLIYIIFIRFVAFYSLFSLSTIIIIITIIFRCWFTSA